MANKVDNLLRGVGSVLDVGSALFENVDPNTANAGAFVDMRTSVCYLMSNPVGEQLAFAMACAILNTRFTNTGILNMVNANGNPDNKYFSIGSERSIIESFLS